MRPLIERLMNIKDRLPYGKDRLAVLEAIIEIETLQAGTDALMNILHRLEEREQKAASKGE